jgi:hypothetical protein
MSGRELSKGRAVDLPKSPARFAYMIMDALSS